MSKINRNWFKISHNVAISLYIICIKCFNKVLLLSKKYYPTFKGEWRNYSVSVRSWVSFDKMRIWNSERIFFVTKKFEKIAEFFSDKYSKTNVHTIISTISQFLFGCLYKLTKSIIMKIYVENINASLLKTKLVFPDIVVFND